LSKRQNNAYCFRGYKCISDEYIVAEASDDCIYALVSSSGKLVSPTSVYLQLEPNLQGLIALGELVEQEDDSELAYRVITLVDLPSNGNEDLIELRGNYLKEGVKIKFFKLDRNFAKFELEAKLSHLKETSSSIFGGLVFNCFGRGIHFYNEDSVTCKIFSKFYSSSLGGFYCNGEYAPFDSHVSGNKGGKVLIDKNRSHNPVRTSYTTIIACFQKK